MSRLAVELAVPRVFKAAPLMPGPAVAFAPPGVLEALAQDPFTPGDKGPQPEKNGSARHTGDYLPRCSDRISVLVPEFSRGPHSEIQRMLQAGSRAAAPGPDAPALEPNRGLAPVGMPSLANSAGWISRRPAIASAAGTLSEESFPAVRLRPSGRVAASLTVSMQAQTIGIETQSITPKSDPLEWLGTALPHTVPVFFPGPRGLVQARALAQAQLAASACRTAETAAAEPVESLEGQASLPPCEYRTRSMLLGGIGGGSRK